MYQYFQLAYFFIIKRCLNFKRIDPSYLELKPLLFQQTIYQPKHMLGTQPIARYTHHPDRQHSSHHKKQYSYEEMKSWCEQLLKTKTHQLISQINQNNEVIKVLSEKIKHLQIQVNKKQQQTMARHTNYHYASSPTLNDEIIHIMNNLLNSKLKDIQDEVTSKLNVIQQSKTHFLKHQSKKEIESYQIRMQTQINHKIKNIKNMVKERLEQTEKVNTQYWGKIKTWLKKLQERFNACLQKGDNIEKKLDSIEEGTGKTILGIYKMRNFDTRVRQIEISVYELEQSFKNITDYQRQYKNLVQIQPQNNYIEEVEYMPHGKQIDSVIQLSRQREQQRKKSINKFSKLSPLHNNLSDIEDSRILLHNSFYSNATARKPAVSIGDLKRRLLELTTQKGIDLPLSCYRDQLGYLKNTFNNYIFDTQGNMFKISVQDFQQLSSPPVNLLQMI